MIKIERRKNRKKKKEEKCGQIIERIMGEKSCKTFTWNTEWRQNLEDTHTNV